MDPTRAARRLCNIAVALAVTLGAAMLLSGCITVPAGTEAAFTGNDAILRIVAEDQELELSERLTDDAARKAAKREAVYGGLFDWTALNMEETSGTLALRQAFIDGSLASDAEIEAFDLPLNRWRARGEARVKALNDARKNASETLDALKAAQTTTTTGAGQ